ncbi:MAG: hypothetical protein O7F76_07055, partial [Planctomycetota bacterium]|nr:hypothetical protein [Planctomycetota bacterium]
QSELCERTEVRLYNCASLLERENPRWLKDEVERAIDRLFMTVGGKPKLIIEDRSRLQTLSGFLEAVSRHRTVELRQVILSSVDPDSWTESGGSAGSLTIFDDVLVIVQTADNHDSIGRLLDKLSSVCVAGKLARSD